MLVLLPLSAADYPQLLDEFRKTRPDVSKVHVIAESPLLVAVTGDQTEQQTPSQWAKGELLGVFAHRGDGIVQISMVPNDDFPAAVWIDSQSPDSITFALAEYSTRSENLKIFFDAKTYFPKRIVRFAPVRVRRIALVAGVLTLSGSDGNQDFTARERNGTWRVATAPAVPEPAPQPIETQLQSISEKAKQFPQVEDEKIGPYEKVGNRIWVGKTFLAREGAVGVGDIGYFDATTQDWAFLHIPEMADWSASALLVEPTAILVGLMRQGDDGSVAGGLLRYDRVTHKASRIPFADVVDKIIRVGKHVYCGTSGGFAIIEQDRAHRYEFTQQLDGAYTITPVI
jgi:hypothetical protein